MVTDHSSTLLWVIGKQIEAQHMEELHQHDKAFREDDWLRQISPFKTCGAEQSHCHVVSSHRRIMLNDSGAN